ncbi:MAG: SDR family oxidoreductase [Xanthomonadales bacterium]|nr:SDR family oxidoreductase [Xanthomonadales bacterium]
MNHEKWRLDGSRALITGGSSGIGLAVAQELAALGCGLVLLARNPERLEQARELILQQHSQRTVELISADVANAADRERAVSELAGPLTILINNAGCNIRKRVEDLSLEEYLRVQDVNLVSCFEFCRLLHPKLLQSTPAAVVNVASVAGLTHLRTGAPYGMSKAAMIQLTRNLAVEWGEQGIRVNAVAPWYIETPLAQQVLKDESYRQAVLDRTPMKRIGTVEECAAAIAFLCLPAAGYITGHCLTVDGGFSVFGF